MVNLKYLLKNLVFNYNGIIKELIHDYKKDIKSKKIINDTKKIWICGLPKSGTTLVEEILDQLPYIRIDRSVFRSFGNKDMLKIENHEKYVGYFPAKKFSYVKTHLNYNSSMTNSLIKSKFKIIVTFRDIRDVMISRYFHIKNDKDHWQHNVVAQHNFEVGFLNSLTKKTKYFPNQSNFIEPIKYYYDWICNWKKIQDKKILKLWFEDYNKNPEEYLSKILNFTKFDTFNKIKILNIIDQKNSKEKNVPLSIKLKRKNKSLSTFRSGKSGEWKELFTKKIENNFLKTLPDDINNVLNQ